MKGTSYLLVLFLGYVIGILWAPRKGSLLREELVGHFIDLTEAGNEMARTAVAKGSEVAKSAVEKGADLKEIADDSFAKASSSFSQAKDIATESVGALNKNLHNIAESTLKKDGYAK